MNKPSVFDLVISVLVFTLGMKMLGLNNFQIIGAVVAVLSLATIVRECINFGKANNANTAAKALIEEARNAERLIVHYGLNKTERGEPHPQELLLKNLNTAISNVEKEL